jgi:hypothetical protein
MFHGIFIEWDKLKYINHGVEFSMVSIGVHWISPSKMIMGL